jgi:Leucine-rich repeat (LRR) protein
MCHYNISYQELVNIDYSKIPINMTSVDCSNNKLVNINLNEYLDVFSINCRQNNLSYFESMNNLDELDCSFNNINKIKIVNTVNDLNCSNNRLDNLSNILNLCTFENLLTLNFDNNNIEEIKNLPHNLKYLSCAHNKIKYLGNLPDGLTELNCSNNLITHCHILPKTLEKLYINNNKLSEFNVSLDSKLVVLNISNNMLIDTETLSKKYLPMIVQLYCTHTLISNLPEKMSSYLEIIDVRNNNYLHDLPEKMCYCLYNLVELNITNTGITKLQLKYINLNTVMIRHSTLYKIDNVELDWFTNKRIKFTYKCYMIIKKLQRKLKNQFQIKLRAILIIQRGCHNWIWKPVCKDGTVGIRLKLDCLYLDKYVNNTRI